jgi:hypothetical protein
MWNLQRMEERERQLRLSRQCVVDQMKAQRKSSREISHATNPYRTVDDLGGELFPNRNTGHIDLPPPYNPN